MRDLKGGIYYIDCNERFLSYPSPNKITMADRVKLILQKRTLLKSQITNLSNIFDKRGLDNAALKLRMARLTELYNAFEEYNDELAVLDPNNAHQTKFTEIQDRFYTLAGNIEDFFKVDRSI